MAEVCKLFNLSETCIWAATREDFRPPPNEGEPSLVAPKGTWLRIVDVVEKDPGEYLLTGQDRAQKRIDVPEDKLYIPDRWRCRNCNHLNDNYSELEGCTDCGITLYTSLSGGETVHPMRIIFSLLSGIEDGTGLSGGPLSTILHSSLMEAQAHGGSSPKQEPIPEKDLPKEGDIVCDICVERKASLLLVCCKEGEVDGDKNLCSSCLRNLYQKSGTSKCPYCRREVEFVTHKQTEFPKGNIYKEADE